jgi:hypothetical protein
MERVFQHAREWAESMRSAGAQVTKIERRGGNIRLEYRIGSGRTTAVTFTPTSRYERFFWNQPHERFHAHHASFHQVFDHLLGSARSVDAPLARTLMGRLRTGKPEELFTHTPLPRAPRTPVRPLPPVVGGPRPVTPAAPRRPARGRPARPARPARPTPPAPRGGARAPTRPVRARPQRRRVVARGPTPAQVRAAENHPAFLAFRELLGSLPRHEDARQQAQARQAHARALNGLRDVLLNRRLRAAERERHIGRVLNPLLDKAARAIQAHAFTRNEHRNLFGAPGASMRKAGPYWLHVAAVVAGARGRGRVGNPLAVNDQHPLRALDPRLRSRLANANTETFKLLPYDLSALLARGVNHRVTGRPRRGGEFTVTRPLTEPQHHFLALYHVAKAHNALSTAQQRRWLLQRLEGRLRALRP